jgi:DNA-3-methyladenine glycosylase
MPWSSELSNRRLKNRTFPADGKLYSEIISRPRTQAFVSGSLSNKSKSSARVNIARPPSVGVKFCAMIICNRFWYHSAMRKLPHSFYDRDTIMVAKELLGKFLVHKSRGVERVGKIVETEAYLGAHDLAAHSSKGLTERTRVMFGPPGRAYVYFIYGMYFCMNVVTEHEGRASAVLLRAIEPVKNIEGRTCGPGLLCRAMKIGKRVNGHDLLGENFYIAESDEAESFSIVRRPRIGVDYAKHWAKRHLRFYIRNNPFVSRR